MERNWFGARGIAVPTADDDGSGSGDAPGSAAFPATVRFGHQLQGGAADAPSSFVPVDVLFGQDSVSGFGEMIFEPDAAVTFEDGARWEIGDDAAGDDVVFIGGQLRDTACDVSCHRNWFDLQDPRAHDPYRTDLLADGGPGIPAVEVPCSRDSAWFPPVSALAAFLACVMQVDVHPRTARGCVRAGDVCTVTVGLVGRGKMQLDSGIFGSYGGRRGLRASLTPV